MKVCLGSGWSWMELLMIIFAILKGSTAEDIRVLLPSSLKTLSFALCQGIGIVKDAH